MSGREQLRAKIDAAAREWAEVRYQTLCRWVDDYCESPIEQDLLAALLSAFFFTEPCCNHKFQAYRGKSQSLDEAVEYAEFWADHAFRDYADLCINLFAQVEIGRYRADFLLIAHKQWAPETGDMRTAVLNLVIECDGHDHHDLTKEQARRDRQRDRWMQASGFKVLRFAGSEIFRDAEGCAAEVERFVDAWQQEQAHD